MKLALGLLAVALLCQPVVAQNCDDRDVPDDAWFATSISADDLVQMVPRRMLIMRAFWESGPEALVIEDPAEVNDLFSLLAANQRIGHACGYHWGIVFEDSSRRIIQHLHNKKCEAYRNFHDEIQSRLQRYFHRVDTAPTHYLMNVELDPSADPMAIAGLLERDGRRAFLLVHPDSRLPQLRITKFAHGAISRGEDAAMEAIGQKAREKVNAVIELLKQQENARVFVEPRSNRSSWGRGEYETAVEATVVFPLGFDPSRLERYREQLAPESRDPDVMKTLNELEPPFERPASYTLTIASPKPYSKELADAIRAASPAIRGVTPVQRERLDD